jgi:DNA polymerase-3 subunit delta
MTALKAGEVDSFLRRPDPRYPIVLIYGPDHGLVSERARLLARSAVENPDDPFQLIRMDGDQLASDPMRLVDEAHTVPMFGGKRSIWVRMGNNPLAEAIGQLCAVPPRDALIVLEAGELAPKSPLRSLIEKASTAVALPCFVDEIKSLDILVDQGLKQYGLHIDRDAKVVLIERLGADRLMSRNEINKLALYVSGRQRITLADVDAMMTDTGTVNLDQLIDSVFVGDSNNADEMLRRCFAEHLDAGVIVGALLRHAILLQQSRALLDQGKDLASITQASRLHFKRKNAFEKQIRHWRREALETAIAHLFEAQTMARKTSALAGSLVSRCCLQLSLAAKRRG